MISWRAQSRSRSSMLPWEHARSDTDCHFSRFITKTGRETAEDATQIFGGRGITAGGMGKIIENVCDIFVHEYPD